MKRAICLTAVLASIAGPCLAGPTYQAGHISNITTMGDNVAVMLDAGVPDNCTGTAFGWMVIPGGSKAMQALVLAIWARGDASSLVVTVYTDGLVNGYCQINQIDPPG